MANEITASFAFRAAKGNLDVSKTASGQFTLSASAPVASGGCQSIGTAAHEALGLGDVSDAGWAYFKNIDATNYVEIGVDVSSSFYPLVRLAAGEFALFPLSNSAAPYAKANTAAVVLEYFVLAN